MTDAGEGHQTRGGPLRTMEEIMRPKCRKTAQDLLHHDKQLEAQVKAVIRQALIRGIDEAEACRQVMVLVASRRGHS